MRALRISWLALFSVLCCARLSEAADASWEELKQRVESLYQHQRYSEAAAAAELALEVAESTFGPNDSRVAEALNNLANLYRASAEEAKAKYAQKAPLLYQRALAVTEASLGPNHPSVATIGNNLAKLYQTMGRNPEAERLYQRALRIREAEYGRRHPRVAEILTNLAELYAAQGRAEEARPLYVRAAEIYEAAFGADHPAVITAQQRLRSLTQTSASASSGAGTPTDQRVAPATAAMDQPAEWPDTLGATTSGAELEVAAQTRWKLTAMEEALGPDHPSLVPVLTSLASLYRGQGRFDEAEALFKRALAIDEKRDGADSEAAAADAVHLAELYHAQHRCTEAAPYYDRFLTFIEKTAGPKHPDYPNALAQYLQCVKASGNKQALKAAKARAKRAGLK